MSKRAEIRERRARQRRRRVIVYTVLVVAAAAILAALVIYPSVAPIGDIVSITPGAHPQAQGRVLGDPQAAVLIELYEDFQCPTCGAFSRTDAPRLIQAYVSTGQARLAFRQFPFIGDESFQAANASMCADEQDRFWDYYDMLFANQSGENRGAFSNRRLEAFAENLGLDMTAFRACFDDRKYEAEIQAEKQTGIDLGVQSTPTIVVDGQIVQGPDPRYLPTYDGIAAAVEAALAR